MSNAPDQVRKRAMKRLMQDYEELKNSPVESVSAAPLESNMFEWHCNFDLGGTPFHVILFFPNNYPYDSPSAEFVPKGFIFTSGATLDGKKGVRVCLSIFSDFAYIHTEWANEKGMGWSPGYTVQTILLNLVSFLAETRGEKLEGYVKTVWDKNEQLAKKYVCKDCGHCLKKPFPELTTENTTTRKPPQCKKGSKLTLKPQSDHQIVDYISKAKFNPNAKPKDKEELYGYGLVVSGPQSRPSLTTPCEFLTGESFYGMMKSMGKVHSMLKDELKVFLPMYLTKAHGSAIQKEFEAAMESLKTILPNCKAASIEKMVLKTIPNLMSATVVDFSKGTQYTSDNHLNGYFALHRLFLWAIETYPTLQETVDNRLKEFIEDESKRSKSACPHIGEWLMLLSASSKYIWSEAADAYLSESWKRNVMWYVKDNADLGMLDHPKQQRIKDTYTATLVSRKLLAFQVLFLNIAMPASLRRDQIIARYDKNMGFPTSDMVQAMKQAVAQIDSIKSYQDWFKVLNLNPPSDDEIYDRLVKAVEFSINTNGYKWTFFKNQGGWTKVLKRYPNGTPGWENSAASEGKGKGKGKKSKQSEPEDAPPAKKGRAKSADKTEEAPTKGKGRCKKSAETAETAAKGRGRGKKSAQAETADQPAKGRGRGIKMAGLIINSELLPGGKGCGKTKMDTTEPEKPGNRKRTASVKPDAKAAKQPKVEEKAAKKSPKKPTRGRGKRK